MMPAVHLLPPPPLPEQLGASGPLPSLPGNLEPELCETERRVCGKIPQAGGSGVLLPEALEGVFWVWAHIPAEQSGPSFRCA